MSSITDAMLGSRFAHMHASLAVLFELERRRQQAAGGPFRPEINRRRALALILQERGLGIEHIELRRPPAHEEHDVVLRFGREVGELRRGRGRGAAWDSSGIMPSRPIEPSPPVREAIHSRLRFCESWPENYLVGGEQGLRVFGQGALIQIAQGKVEFFRAGSLRRRDGTYRALSRWCPGRRQRTLPDPPRAAA